MKNYFFILILTSLSYFFQEKDISDIDKILTESSSEKVNLSDFISGYALLDFFSCDDHYCITYTKNNSTYFSIINNDSISTVKDNFENYIFTRFSYFDNIVSNSYNLKNSEIYNFNLKTKINSKIKMEHPFSFTNVLSTKNYLFFYGGSEGNFIYSIYDDKIVKDTIEGSINPLSSNISLPIKNNTVLLSKQVDDKLFLKCFIKNSVSWEKELSVGNIYSQLKIINFEDLFVVAFNNNLLLVDEKDGKRTNSILLDSSDFNIYVFNNKMFVFEKIKEDESTIIKISYLDKELRQLKFIKKIVLNDRNDQYINFLNEKIIFRTEESLKIYSLKNLQLLDSVQVKSKLTMDNYIDNKTGENILMLNNKYIYR